MSNVVVTGGYGLIGSHLVSALLDRGDSVTVFDFAKNTRDSSIDFDRHANFRFVQGDVTDLIALRKGPDSRCRHGLSSGRGRRCQKLYERSAAGSRCQRDRHSQRPRAEPSARNTRGVRQHVGGVREKPQPAVRRGRRSCAGFDKDRAVELQHQQGHGRASRLRDAHCLRIAGDRSALFQCLWPTAESDIRGLADRSPDPQWPPAVALRLG